MQAYTRILLLPTTNRLTNIRNISNQINPKSTQNVGQRAKTDEIIALEKEKVAHNYTPLSDVVFDKAEGPFLWSVEGKRYFDFICGFSALNQGHRHPKIVAAMKAQVDKITLTGRALHNDVLSRYADFLTSLLGYDKMLPMNGGVEAAETAVKLARRWAYEVKGVPKNEAKVIFCSGNFWGRSIAAVTASTDPLSYQGYGPYVPGFVNVPFNDLTALEYELKDPNVAAFMVEPIQGEAGVIVPDDGYLKSAQDLCFTNNALMICDEIQTGLGRCGTLLACYHEELQPDIVVLGKALSGGIMPISAVMADDAVMLRLTSGTHGSTFGGNPLAAAVAIASLEVLIEEDLSQKALKLGEIFRKELENFRPDMIREIRGRGLFNAIEVRADSGFSSQEIVDRLRDYGIITKATHDYNIRMAPALVITKEQLMEAIGFIKNAFESF